MNPRNFFAELKRRNVLRAAAIYAAAVWALAQGIAQLAPALSAPEWITRWFLIAAAIGFPFWIALAWFYEWTPQGFQLESEIAPNESKTRQNSRKLDRWIIAILALAVVLLLTDRFVLHSSAGAKIPEKSVAVLPLTNESGDNKEQYFSDGLSDDLITALSQFTGLKVIGRDSSFRFRNTKDDSATIGAKLGVAHLLEGSVQRADNVVRISAELINASDGSTLWSQRYDRPYQDLFKLQDDITQAVATALKGRLLNNTATPVQTDRPPSGNLAAYNALLQGNFYCERRTADDTRKAIGYYEEAIRLDPRYALASAKLSLAMETLASNYAGIATKQKQEAAAKARAAAERALQLDPNLAEGHLAKGRVLEDFDFNIAGAEAECRRALELAPQDPEVMRNLASLLSYLGRFDEAVALTQRAVVLDPLRSAAEFTLANYLIALGRYDEAEAAMRKAIALQPQSAQNYAQLVRIQILRGNPAAAMALAKQETDPFWRTYGLALACSADGDRAEADAELKKLIDQDADDAGSQIASVYALRKEPEKMFEWLEHAWSTHDAGVVEMLADPFLRAYKDDPRFIAFAQKIGVMPKPAATP
ncbi:MAG TPA: tetratricopeptide repeat protein [Chthoniobacterales bacterium]